MPYRAYIDKTFRADAQIAIARAERICSAYAAQGLDLTLRQLYYRFVASGWIPNEDKAYKRLGDIINDARLAGQLDWDYIVDRTRSMEQNSHWANPASVIRSAARGYAEDKWAQQDTYVEVWIEKDALVGVLEAVCPANDVPYFSCRGYTSQSEVWSAAQRIGRKISSGKQAVIIHLGDHDPSGIDMSRDIEDRLRMFIAQDIFDEGPVPTGTTRAQHAKQWYGYATAEALDIQRIALNWDQIQQYAPPPNPCKINDSRAAGYIDRFGMESWELDALEPATLIALIQGTIDSHKDSAVWEQAVQHEDEQRLVLTRTADHWTQVAEHVATLGF